MTEQDLIKRVAANHRKKALGEMPIKDRILEAAMALKMAANKQGVMQTKTVFATINRLLLEMARETQASEDANIKSVGTRLLREHKALSTSLV